MKKKKSSRVLSLIITSVFFLLVFLGFIFLGESGIEVLETDAISWAGAVEKCKATYKSQRPAGTVKVSNCRKRLWDDDYFYFYWSKPLFIFIKKSNGELGKHPGTCQVERDSGEIVYMTLDDKVLVKKARK